MEEERCILLADSGSTKTDWCIVEHAAPVTRIKTAGFNPFFQTEEEITTGLREQLLPRLAGLPRPDAVYFYGAGCASAEKNELLRHAIRHFLPVRVEIGSDLLGAARSLCGHRPGIACIMGTGSNSCYFDGTQIVENVSPLGYILGDEGSGAVLGKLLVGDILKKQLPASICEAFFEETGYTPAMIVEQVYRRPFPNRFLAGFAPFIRKHMDEPAVAALVGRSFRSFFIRNVQQYNQPSLPVHLTGSIAWHFRDEIVETLQSLHLVAGHITAAPMDGMIGWHTDY